MTKILTLVINVIVLGLTLSPSFAETFPSRTITLVVPFAAGTLTDSVARFFAENLTKSMNVPVIVENKAGANGVVGARAFVSDAKPDGYSVFITTNSTHAAAASLFKSLSFDPINDFAPIARLIQTPLVLIVRPDLPAASPQALMKLAAARSAEGKELSCGSGSSSSQIGAELIAQAAKAKVNRIPYNGNNKAIVDVMANRVDFMVADLGTALPQIQAGKVRALAITSKKRMKQLPDLPTLAEAGIPDFEFIGWFAAFTKAGTPPEVISKLNKHLLEVLKSPGAARFFDTVVSEAFPSTPAELSAFVESETKKWATWVDVAGIEKQ